MSIPKKIITAIFIAAIVYVFTIDPNGLYLVPVAKLIKIKGETKDARVHSLDLQSLRTPEQ